MKKLILLILLIPSLLFAGPLQQAHKKVIASQTVAGGEVTNGAVGTISHTTGGTINGSYQYFDAASKTPSASGSVRYGHIYVNDSNGVTICAGLYDSSHDLLLSGTGTRADDSPGWINIDCGDSVVISTGSTYYLSYGGQGVSVGMDGTGGMVNYSDVACGAATLTSPGLFSYGSQLTIYFDNNAGSPE